MPNYRAPGVYVEEVPSGARMFGRAGTSSVGVIGVAPKADAPQNTVVTIDNWSQFVRIFVGDATAGTHLSTAVHGYFLNGGSRAYVVNLGKDGTLAGKGNTPGGLNLLEAIDDVSIVCAPGYTDPASHDALVTHCEHPLRQDRVAILDLVEDVDDVGRLLEVATAGVPEPAASAPGSDAGDGDDTAADSGSGGSGGGGGRRSAPAGKGLGPIRSKDGYAATYYPWLVVMDPVTGEKVTAPPSGHMAGVWARTDGTRGVHKAPANTNIAGALDLKSRVSKGDQELLNPAGINCIRYFTGDGILVWGGRTLAAEASEFRYINVRRLTNMIKESILDGTRWAVFEPNHHPLWAALRRDVNAFLTNVWRDGALVGTTPGEAFYVKCDAETNPPEVRDAGMVVTEVGIAPVKPAEFVVFKLMQSADQPATETSEA